MAKATYRMTPNGGPELMEALRKAGFTEEAIKKMSLQEARNALFLHLSENQMPNFRVGRAANRAKGASPLSGRMGPPKPPTGAGVTAAEGAAEGLGGFLRKGWGKLPPVVRLLGKGAGVGLGALGLVGAAMEVPEMLRGGRNIAEDLGFDPTGRREATSQNYQNDLLGKLLGGDDRERELAYQGSVDNQLGPLEAVSRDRSWMPDNGEDVARDQALQRLLQGHEEELGAIQARAARTNDMEMIARRLGSL